MNHSLQGSEPKKRKMLDKNMNLYCKLPLFRETRWYVSATDEVDGSHDWKYDRRSWRFTLLSSEVGFTLTDCTSSQVSSEFFQVCQRRSNQQLLKLIKWYCELRFPFMGALLRLIMMTTWGEISQHLNFYDLLRTGQNKVII